MTATTSAVIQSMLPKMKYSRSFSISCQLGTMSFERALYYLGASIILMPLSICKRLGIWEMKPTNMSLQLADRSVKVGYLYIPTNFIIIDFQEDLQVPIIVGRPILCIVGTIIDVK